jgi:hypothetical protein
MSDVPGTPDDERKLRVVRLFIYLGMLSVLIAAGAGLVLLISDPEPGSTSEATLGITAAIAGLGTALFAGIAAIYAQINNLWRYAPMWIRTTIMAIVIVGLIITIVSWIRSI